MMGRWCSSAIQSSMMMGCVGVKIVGWGLGGGGEGSMVVGVLVPGVVVRYGCVSGMLGPMSVSSWKVRASSITIGQWSILAPANSVRVASWACSAPCVAASAGSRLCSVVHCMNLARSMLHKVSFWSSSETWSL
eukprot:3368061-Rhodomonas_salina.1